MQAWTGHDRKLERTVSTAGVMLGYQQLTRGIANVEFLCEMT